MAYTCKQRDAQEIDKEHLDSSLQLCPSDTNVREAILSTVHLFDVHGVALTPLEVWRYLYHPTGMEPVLFSRVYDALRHDPVLRMAVTVCEGFVTYTKRAHAAVSAHNDWKHGVRVRQTGAWYGARFRRRLFRFAKLLTALPYMRMVGASNHHGIDRVRSTSDIDLFIVVKPGMLWLVNDTLKLLTLLTGLRASPKRHARRFCFCYSVSATPTAMALSSCTIENDLIAPVVAQLIRPLDDVDDLDSLETENAMHMRRRFYEQNQAWVSQWFPHASEISSVYAHPLKRSYFGSAYRVRRHVERLIPEFVAQWVAVAVGKIHKRYRAWRGEPSRRGTSVVMEDDIQKAHPKDIRSETWQAYTRQCERYERWARSFTSSSASSHMNTDGVQNDAAPTDQGGVAPDRAVKIVQNNAYARIAS